MEAYAVIETGGKQYRVRENDALRVERLEAEVGSQVAIDAVLAVSDGKQLRVGTPRVEGASVSSTVLDHVRGEKVVSFKKKRRKGYSRKVGHRQELTVLRVDKIASGASKARPANAQAAAAKETD
jgi:large subunit ribosomal protein L21